MGTETQFVDLRQMNWGLVCKFGANQPQIIFELNSATTFLIFISNPSFNLKFYDQQHLTIFFKTIVLHGNYDLVC